MTKLFFVFLRMRFVAGQVSRYCLFILLGFLISCKEKRITTIENIGIKGDVENILLLIDSTSSERLFFDESARPLETQELVYDSITKQTVVETRIVFSYNTKKVMILEEGFDRNQESIWKFAVQSDRDGFPVTKEMIKGEGINKIEYALGADSLTIRSFYNEKLVDQRIIFYNKEFHPSKETLTYFDDDGHEDVSYTRSYRYLKLDQYQNWIQRRVTDISDTGSWLENRRITYREK